MLDEKKGLFLYDVKMALEWFPLNFHNFQDGRNFKDKYRDTWAEWLQNAFHWTEQGLMCFCES
jgi:hypothetical protein